MIKEALETLEWLAAMVLWLIVVFDRDRWQHAAAMLVCILLWRIERRLGRWRK